MIPNRPEFANVDLPEDPADWPRVKVIPPSGIPVFKDIPDVDDHDFIVQKKDGSPIFVYGKPGRPKSQTTVVEVPKAAEASEVSRARTAERLRQKEASISVDPLVQSIKNDVDSTSLLHLTLLSLAEEQAALKYDRIVAEREGELGTGYSMRRIKALETLANNWLKRKSLIDSTSVDLESKAFGVVFKMIVETFTQALADAQIEPETVRTIISNFANMVKKDEWKAEVKAAISNATQ